MNEFRDCLLQQLKMHPVMQPRDVVKLCYQAACGAEHLLTDTAEARRYFAEEFASVPPRDEPLFERISDRVCRVNLGAWKQTGLHEEWLFRMFADTVFQTDGKARLTAYLDAAEAVLRDLGYDMAHWHSFLAEYQGEGMPPVRHSEAYREAERPAYRIVDAAHLPLLRRIALGDEETITEMLRDNNCS